MKEVGKVDLFTRLVADPSVDAEYGEPIEEIGDNVRIVRIDAGPSEEYLYKETPLGTIWTISSTTRSPISAPKGARPISCTATTPTAAMWAQGWRTFSACR